MSDDSNAVIRWRLHLASPPERVFAMLATDVGRARFWTEAAVERDGAIAFAFPNGMTWRGAVLANDPPRRFTLNDFDSITTFDLAPNGAGGTDLMLTDASVSEDDRRLGVGPAGAQSSRGLRHQPAQLDPPQRSWDQGSIDN